MIEGDSRRIVGFLNNEVLVRQEWTSLLNIFEGQGLHFSVVSSILFVERVIQLGSGGAAVRPDFSQNDVILLVFFVHLQSF